MSREKPMTSYKPMPEHCPLEGKILVSDSRAGGVWVALDFQTDGHREEASVVLLRGDSVKFLEPGNETWWTETLAVSNDDGVRRLAAALLKGTPIVRCGGSSPSKNS